MKQLSNLSHVRPLPPRNLPRDAATGKLLAESDYFEPMPGNGLIVPTFGGRFYYPTAAGKGFYVLQVMPKAAVPAK